MQSTVTHITSAASRRDLSLAFVEAASVATRHARRASTASVPTDRSQPQVALARIVEANPGISVQGAAQALSLAPNTISTLVGQLVDANWIERRTSTTDRRVVHLHLTALGSEEMRTWRERGADAVEDAVTRAVGRLGEQRVAEAVEALQVLAELLQEEPTNVA